MELRHVRYFVAVAEELHFGNAAKRLNISQPPLTQQIQNLEAELNVQLFERKNRKVFLTPAGYAFYEKSLVVLKAASVSIDTARRVDAGAEEEISVGYNSAVMLTGLVPILSEFHAKRPSVYLSLKQLPSNRQYESVASGELDAGFVDISSAVFAKKQYIDEITISPAIQFPLVAALPLGHSLAEHKTVSLEALRDEEFVILARHQYASLHDLIISLCHRAGFSPNIKVEAEQTPAVLAHVAANFGVAIVPDCSIPGWRRSLAFVNLDQPDTIETHIITRKGSKKLSLEHFVSIVSEEGQELYRDAYANLIG